ncbi:MAG: carboxypeptidase-like regulatory domain-containing protein [Gemmatimonadota bacterium]|nr:carboxypeptidase-like regulatory domain-containing protein [Gemmatimonadota bacterium]
MRRPPSHAIRYLSPLLLLAAGIPIHADAQTVRGRLLDPDGVTGLGSAMVVLEDRNGTEVERALSRNNGLFQLTAPAPGSYRLRAERIGYATTHTDFFDLAAGETITQNIVAAVQAITLEGIEAGGERKCTVRPAEGLAVTRVWEEARKALSAAAWTQERGYYQYEMMNVNRRLEPESRKVLGEERSYNRGYMQAPYVSRPADSLVNGGFARITPRESLYWAPDAEVLLSDPFLDTHCFNLRTDAEEAPGLIGLSFEPVPGRRLPDIGGTLWLDLSTSRLERLDFTYRNLNLPRTILTSGIGGTLEFEALPNGTWIVNSWRIRMPKAGMGTNLISGGGTAVLQEIIVQGGDVIRVHGNEGTVLEADDLGGGIAGVILDTLRAGLPNARVFVEGTGIESFTDPDGKFQLAGLEPGVYSVTFSHPYLEPYAYTPEPFEVEVLADTDTPAQISFTAPTVARIIRGLCRDVERPESTVSLGQEVQANGILVGRVTDSGGDPVPNASVRILSGQFDVGGPVLRMDRGGVIVSTNESGYYRACWMPVDSPLDVAVLDPDETDPSDVEAASLLTEEQEVILSPASPLGRLDLRINPM